MRVFLGAICVLSLLVGAPASGAPRGPARPGSTAPALPRDVKERLESGDAGKIQSALDDVRLAGKGGASAVPVIVLLLQRGLDAKLTRAAIETLADTESEAASETLAWYARHRDVTLRRAAIKALAKTQGPVASKALRAALSDGDVQVRGLAATALGASKTHDAVPDLFAALDHKINEAAASIGLLCAGDECLRLAGKLGVLPFDVVVGGLDQVLFRPPSEVSDEIKAKIISQIRGLGTAEAHKYLVEAQGKWPSAWSAQLKQIIEEAIVATSAGSGGAAP